MTFRILHVADLHLDAPFAWATARSARLRRRNRRETLSRILQLAGDERVDALFCAGDLFEHERVSPDTVEFLRASFARTDISIFLAPGNHDWYSASSPYATVEWSPNVHLFREAQLEPFALTDGLTLWGAAHRAPANTDPFFAGFRVNRGGVHLALAHASERGALGWQEHGKQPHAPFDAAEIEASGIAHAFLGHYHVPRDAERYSYPGNPDPLDFGEEGDRGAVLAEVEADGTVRRQRHRVAVSEVHDLTLSVDGAAHSEDVRDALSSALAALTGWARVTLIGEVASSVQVDAGELAEVAAHLEGVVVRLEGLSAGYDLTEIAGEATVRGQFVRDATSEIDDPDLRRRVVLTGLRALEGRRDLGVA